MYGNLINGVLPYAYLKIGNTNIYPGSIAAEPGLSVIQTLCGEDGYAIGNFGSAQLTMSVANNALPDNVSGQPITVYMGYTDEDETVTADNVIQVGEFYTTEDKIVTKGLFTTITAYDASYYAVGLYLPTGTPTTVGAVVTDVCTQAGLQIASDAYSQVKMATSTPIADDLAGLSYRDVIAHCALLLGANACIDRFGKLTFNVPGRAPVASFGPGNYIYSDYSLQSNAEYTMGRLQVNYTHEVTTGAGTEEQDTEEVTETFIYQAPGTTSEKGILIETGSIKTQAAANTLGAALFGQNGFSLYGYSLKVGGRPEFDLADAFTLTDEDESVKTFYALSHTLTYNGSLSSEFSASVPTEDVTSLDTTQRATLSEQVQQLSGLSARLNRVMADLVVATNAKFDKVVTNVLEADEFKAGVGTIVNAKIDNLEVNSINGNVIREGTVLAKALSNEAIQTLGGSKVFYQAEQPTDAKAGDSWYKTVVPEGYTGKILFVYDGSNWVGKDLDAKLLQANSITAQEIASNTITANNIAGGTITADKINTDSLATSDLWAKNITATNFNLKGGSIDIETTEETEDKIRLSYAESGTTEQGTYTIDTTATYSPMGFDLESDKVTTYEGRKETETKTNMSLANDGIEVTTYDFYHLPTVDIESEESIRITGNQITNTLIPINGGNHGIPIEKSIGWAGASAQGTDARRFRVSSDLEVLGTSTATDFKVGTQSIKPSLTTGKAQMGEVLMQWGTVSVTPSSGSGSARYGSASVTFPTEFSATPFIMACAGDGYTNILNVSAINPTAKTMTVWMLANNTTARTCRWFAIGKA